MHHNPFPYPPDTTRAGVAAAAAVSDGTPSLEVLEYLKQPDLATTFDGPSPSQSYSHSGVSQTEFLKEELKFKIQSKRLAKGLGQLRVEQQEKHYQLTPEEEHKKKTRRERNRIAATKCRNKRKELGENLEKEVKELEEENLNSMIQIRQLEAEKEELESVLRSHQLNCPFQTDTIQPRS